MIYVVNLETSNVLNKCDAWEADGYERMLAWCKDGGWVIMDKIITPMGDMAIYVM